LANAILKKEVVYDAEYLRREFPKLWLATYHHLNVHNQSMSFEDKYRFLKPLYKLEERDICMEKSVQCGASELMVVSCLSEASNGLRILYVMPNIDLRGKFVKDRLDRLLKAVPLYATLIKESYGDSTSIGLKHFGKGLLNFVGSNSGAEFISYPADALYIDEVDKCDQSNLEMAPDRLDASDYKYIRRIGNPSVQNWGIDSYYLESSQGRWFIKCKSCGHSQNLDFFQNVIRKTGEMTFNVLDEENEQVYAVCKKCGKRIDRMKQGEWMHIYPDRERRGFRINQLFSANIELSSLVKQYRKGLGSARKMQVFINSKLGLPFSSSDNKITYELLQKASEGNIYSLNNIFADSYKRVYIGIDVGTYYHVIVRGVLDNGQRKLIDARKFEATKHLVNYLKKFRTVKYIVIDEDPEIREVEKIKKEVTRAYSCRYKNGETLLDLRKAREGWKKERRIRIDRTFILDEVKADFEKQLIINPIGAKDICNEELEEFGEYYEQLLSSTRVFVETSGSNRNKFEWRESGLDHFFHAEAYCKLAEMVDPNIFSYYTRKVEEQRGLTKEETYSEEERKKTLIPRMSVREQKAIETGEIEIEDSKTIKELSVISAESFLRNMFYHTEELLGQRRKKK